MLIDRTCPECGWEAGPGTPGRVAYDLRRHSCDRQRRRIAAQRGRQERAVAFAATRIPRDCTCPGRPHKHGTNAAYKLDRCRCQPCTDAASAYARDLRRKHAYGRGPLVDASEAVAHVRALQEAGLGHMRIARLAGLHPSHLSPFLYGRPDRNGGGPRTKARPATVQAILSVPLPTLDQLGASTLVPATGTRRRLQALVALGWPVIQIAARAEMPHRQPLDRALREDTPTVTARTARVVRDVYAKLENTPPVPSDSQSKGAISAAKARARRSGWLPPAWWEPETIDDPESDPLALPPNASMTDRLTVARILHDAGMPLVKIATRTGTSRSALSRWLREPDAT